MVVELSRNRGEISELEEELDQAGAFIMVAPGGQKSPGRRIPGPR